MITKNELKYFSDLLTKKQRTVEKKFLIEGKKLLLEALDSHFLIEIAFTTNQFFEDNPDIIKSLRKKQVRLEIIKSQDMARLSDTESQPGIIAALKILPPQKSKKTLRLIVGLERISDPGNLGTILRTCDWFGFTDIVISKESVDVYNPKVIRASMGSIFHLNISTEIDLVDYAEQLKRLNYQILAADLEGDFKISSAKTSNVFIVFANESLGPSLEILAVCTNRIFIPRFGKAESLNVASAAAILLSQFALR